MGTRSNAGYAFNESVEYPECICIRRFGFVSVYSNTYFSPSLYFCLLLVSSVCVAFSLVIRIRRISLIYIYTMYLEPNTSEFTFYL
jgi:hypothetical protein